MERAQRKVASGMLDAARDSVSKWIYEINEIPPKPELEAREGRTAMWEEKLKGLGNPGSKIKKGACDRAPTIAGRSAPHDPGRIRRRCELVGQRGHPRRRRRRGHPLRSNSHDRRRYLAALNETYKTRIKADY